LCTLLQILRQMLYSFPQYQQNHMLSHTLTLLSSLYIVKLDSDLSLRLHLFSYSTSSWHLYWSHFCLLKLHHILTYLFVFHYHELWCPVCF
jgi:hypothetical protein